MREQIVTLVASVPASVAAQATIYLYEKCDALWAEVATEEEVQALRDLLKRKEGDDA